LADLPLGWRHLIDGFLDGKVAAPRIFRPWDGSEMKVRSFDHIVLTVRDVPGARAFYERVLGMESREERPGKWSLHFGQQKISLQDAQAMAALASATTPGSGNFCLLTDMPMADVVAHLGREGVAIAEGPGQRAGACGPILSVYFRDPDGNLVEVSNQL
jgi:catechol 2,3-dioxygenase-like lactoylglutathione lyase family enzyme